MNPKFRKIGGNVHKLNITEPVYPTGLNPTEYVWKHSIMNKQEHFYYQTMINMSIN